MKRLTIWTFGLLAVAGIAAENEIGGPVDTKAAFARLKTLVGEWKGVDEAKGERLKYELIAGGTSLVETETAANRPEMVTVYHLDGNRLLLTHYCMAGNQPRMQAREFDAKSGRLRFDFLDATNLANQDAGHMHSVTMRLTDKDHLASEWTFYEAGKPKMTEATEYTRVR